MAHTTAKSINRTTEQNARPRFLASVETRLIYQRLRSAAVGEIVSYRELNDLVSIDVQKEGRGALQSARRIAQRDDRATYDVVPNVGLRRLSDHEIIVSAPATFGKMRRAARRGAERLFSVAEWDGLTPEDKALHNASLSALRVVEHISKPKSLTRLTAAVNTTNTGELPIARTLELFRGPKPE